MRFFEMSRVLSRFFFYFAAILLIPLTVALIYECFYKQIASSHLSSSMAFLETIGLCLLFSLFFSLCAKKAKEKLLYRKECVFLVVLLWFLGAGLGALPFLFSKTITRPIDAYFESMSGLTTTGATILQARAYDKKTGKELPITQLSPIYPNLSYTFYGTVSPLKNPQTGAILKEGIEAIEKPLLFWRSFLQWLGGIGVVVLFIALLPAIGMGGKFLYESEVGGPSKEGLAPRIKETAKTLTWIYLALTLLQIAILSFTDRAISFFDAVTLSLATIATGGFTIHNDGFASYTSLTRWIVTFFMLFGGINFALYYHVLKRKWKALYDQELFFYLVTLFFGSLLLTLGLKTLLPTQKALSLGFFEAVSIQTSTGFGISNIDQWPFSSQILMIFLMYLGGMSGSAAGGIKTARWFIALQIMIQKVELFFRPSRFRIVRINSKELSDKTATSILLFFFLTLLITAIGVYLLTLNHIDPLSALSIISSMITNNGLYFGAAGSTESLAFLPDFSKIICILWMVLGRLEFYSVLVLCSKSFWKKS